MMRIVLEDLGKRYNRNWIFKGLNYEIEANTCQAITGPNGSGKSTFLKIISTYAEATRGKIRFFDQNKLIDNSEIAIRVAYAAPYLNIIEEMTLKEAIRFHSTFRQPTIAPFEMAERAMLAQSWNKPISYFSSGMKQRLKLILALFFKSDLLLLDEPTANMDEQGQGWYRSEMLEKKGTQTILIASNSRLEFDFSNSELNISNFKV